MEYKKILENLKNKLTKCGSKKLIETAVIIAIVGVICLIAGSVLFEGNAKNGITGSKSDTAAEQKAVETLKQGDSDSQSDEMKKSLEAILSKIKGAGRVEVMITFFSGNEAIPAYDVKTSGNDTAEKDKEGGSRSIKQSEKESKTIYEEKDGEKKPFIVKELLPRVKGVVIVADGAENADVKISLTRAAEALLDIAAHKIQVFERTKN